MLLGSAAVVGATAHLGAACHGRTTQLVDAVAADAAAATLALSAVLPCADGEQDSYENGPARHHRREVSKKTAEKITKTISAGRISCPTTGAFKTQTMTFCLQFLLLMVALVAASSPSAVRRYRYNSTTAHVTSAADPCGTANPCKVTNGVCGPTSVAQKCCKRTGYRDGYCYFEGGLCLAQCVN